MQPLIDHLKTTLSKSKVEKLATIVSEEVYSVRDLIELSFHQDKQIAFRAAWILENVFFNHNERFLPFTHYFLEKFPLQNNHSALRHYVKILAFITKKNASPEIKKIIDNYHAEEIIEAVFAWLIDEKVPVAVKSFCLNILANLAQKHTWIKDELAQTMEFLVDKESKGFYSKVKIIRKQFSVGS